MSTTYPTSQVVRIDNQNIFNMEHQSTSDIKWLETAILDILPNPVLVKDEQLRYVLVNRAFEALFSVCREELVGKLDKDVFQNRQAVQCNSGDLRVLKSGEIDEALETVFRNDAEAREIITRKNKLVLPDGRVFLVGIMHDITDVSLTNRKLKESQALLREQSAELERIASTDPLTGCKNRRALSRDAEATFSAYGNVGSLIMLDIDHFKRVNDTYGHDVGDAVLVHFSQTVTQFMREEDTLVRLGGEEFAAVLPGAREVDARGVAERIRLGVEKTPWMQQEKPLSITVSLGVVHSASGQPIELGALLTAG